MHCAFTLSRPEPFSHLPPGCQFSVPEYRLIEYNGLTWCSFHCPVDAQFELTQDDLRFVHEEIHQRIQECLEKNEILDLSGVVFRQRMDFSRLTFPATLFNATQFLDGVDFTGAVFGGVVIFDGCQFQKSLSFERCDFRGVISFNSAAFQGAANFRETIFRKLACFDHVYFRNSTDFTGARFQGEASFRFSDVRSQSIQDNIVFERVQFLRKAVITGRQFHGDALFDSAQFLGPADFRNTCFKQACQFRNVVFKDQALFHCPEHNAYSIMGQADFSGTVFYSDVKFINRYFAQTAKFDNCTFHKAPEFHGSSIHQGTTFPPRKHFLDTSSPHARAAYRTLKLAMEQHRARQEEAMFFALEQESLRKQQDTPRSIRWMSWLYKIGADYGESFVRPLGWIACVNAVFWAFYVLTVSWSVGEWPYQDSFRFAMEQLVRPFSAWVPGGGMALRNYFVDGSSGFLLIQFAATFQALVNLGLLALFILAVRRRFKLD
ncbi:MAG: pentapeptide repeat-containing protein [Nitrospirae bacterium]|nr:MAG: pentapeptide repeat-containing protein [Nitrospirota bacterium]